MSSSSFLFLGRTVSYNNSDWAALDRNPSKAQKRWGMIARVLSETGASKYEGTWTVLQGIGNVSAAIWMQELGNN